MQQQQQQWKLEGDYFEGCNCKLICPCIFMEILLKAVVMELLRGISREEVIIIILLILMDLI
jgi:hypothetical protein